jgi:hypothetical protein
MIMAIFRRRLREGATYEEFREASSTTQGFGVPTRVLTAQRLDDPREIKRSFPSLMSMLPLKTLAPSLSAPLKTSASDIPASTR